MVNNIILYSVTIAKNGSMIWNHTDKAKLTMKKFSLDELREYLSKIKIQPYILIMYIKQKARQKFVFKNRRG